MAGKFIMNKNTVFMLKMLGSSLLRRRSRMAIALCGIAIGAAALLCMVTLCYDLPRQMSREFRAYGANMVFVSSDQDSLRMEDVGQAAALLPADLLLGVTPFRYIPVRNNMLPYTAVGTDFAAVKKTSPYWQMKGEWPQQESEILVGADIAQYALLTPGKTIVLDGRNKARGKFEAEFVITGIVRTGGVEDGFIFMRMADMEKMTGENGRVDVVEISLSANEKDLRKLAADIRNDVPAVKARLVKRVTRSEAAVLGKLEALVYLVTLVVLALTMICVATTMITVVMERRREIGLKKALGAPHNRVGREFLAEGLVLGLLGGLAGGICGLLFAQIISAHVFARSITVEFYLLPLTVLVSVVVSITACLLPAHRAMDVEPALVLRGE
ncbi:ABC transporter permease [Deltaproteobacteria bacterium]|nr:ABC transporter permease [Deltaproteobacteria bacterium]